jgi:hypothetical protein
VPARMDDLDQVLDAARELEALIRTATAKPDAATERKARLLCQRMRGINGAMDDSTTEIERLLPVFFSLVQHADHPGGAEAMRNRITRDLLPRIRLRVEALRRLRSTP